MAIPQEDQIDILEAIAQHQANLDREHQDDSVEDAA